MEQPDTSPTPPSLLIFHGLVIHSLGPSELSILPSSILIVQDGRVHSLHPNIPASAVQPLLQTLSLPALSPVTFLSPEQFLLPGFVDTHNHAPQWQQRGLGQGMSLLAWLEDITFANEARFADVGHARTVYAQCVRGMLRQGVTTAAYYGSLHAEATRVLVDCCVAAGQRALVGKCNMNRGAPDWYREPGTEESLHATRECIDHVCRVAPAPDGLVRYVITPRFAISCTDHLLRGLGEIAAENPDLPIQTHFAEAAGEVRATLSLFPEFDTEADLYAHFGLLTDRTVLAHCTRMGPAETARIRELGCGIAHCPTANMTVGGGFMAAPVARWLREWGIAKVGLGTDIGGGFAPGILDAMRHALVVSYARCGMDRGERLRGAEEDRDCAVSGLMLDEVVYMATLGGARVLGLGSDVGSFEPGKKFDAVVADLGAGRDGVSAPLVAGQDGPRTVLEKFVMTGDDRNLASVFVDGRLVHGAMPSTCDAQ